MRSTLINGMVTALSKTGSSLRRDFAELEHLQAAHRRPDDFVRNSARRAEEKICKSIAELRPHAARRAKFFGREASEGSEDAWIVTGLGNSENFAKALPNFSVSLALEHRGDVVAAVVYCPLNEDIYSAQRGGGTFFNDRRARVSSTKKREEYFVGMAPCTKNEDVSTFLTDFATISLRVSSVRIFGNSDLELAWVSSGRLDGWFSRGAHADQFAAGSLLVTEAGGSCSLSNKSSEFKMKKKAETKAEDKPPSSDNETMVAGAPKIYDFLCKFDKRPDGNMAIGQQAQDTPSA